MYTPFIEQVRVGKTKLIINEKNQKQYSLEDIKKPVIDEVYARKLSLEGDELVRGKIGIEDRALFAYPKIHYQFWKESEKHQWIDVGSMAENIVIADTDEFHTFIGDIYQYGEAIIQVSQPHVPTWRLGYLLDDIELPRRMVHSGRTGWYYRILEEGMVEPMMELKLLERPYPNWSVARVNEILFREQNNLQAAYELKQCSLLGKEIQSWLNKRLRGQGLSLKRRFYMES